MIGPGVGVQRYRRWKVPVLKGGIPEASKRGYDGGRSLNLPGQNLAAAAGVAQHVIAANEDVRVSRQIAL